MDFFRKLTGTLDGRSRSDANGLSLTPTSGPDATPTPFADLPAAGDNRVATLSERLELQTRVQAADAATRTLRELEARISTLEATVEKAEARADAACERAADAEKHRDALQALIARAGDTLARLETLQPIAASLEQLEGRLPSVREECAAIVTRQNAFRQEFDALNDVTTDLNAQVVTLRQGSVEARENADRAVRTVADVQEKLDALAKFDSVNRDTAAQLRALNALAERVTSKAKALDQQHQTIEHALVESRKVSEMVWAMDAQIARLTEGSAVAARVEDTITRIERTHDETTRQLTAAEQSRDQFTALLEQRRREGAELLGTLHDTLDKLGLKRKEFDTLHERVAATQTALTDAERRLATVSTSEETVKSLTGSIDRMSGRLDGLTAEARTLEQRHQALNVLGGRLSEVEDTAKRIDWQLAKLDERRGEIEGLQTAFTEFDSLHSHAQSLIDALRSDKQQLAHFVDRTAAFMRDVPAITGQIERLTTGVTDVERRAARAMSMQQTIDNLATAVADLTPRLQLVGEVQARLNELHRVSTEVDGTLAQQLARKAEIDSLRVACDGLGARLTDAQECYAMLAAAQAKLSSIPEQVATIDAALETTRTELQLLSRDRESLAGHEQTFTALHESMGALTHSLTERMDTMQRLDAELGRAGMLKNEVGAALEHLQNIQRETIAHSLEAADRLRQIGDRCSEIHHKQSDIDSVMQSVIAVERRIQDLEESSHRVDAQIDAVASRERIVQAVKQEIEEIHGIAQRAEESLAAAADGHRQLTEQQADIDRLMATLGTLIVRIEDVEARGAAVDDVRRKAEAVAGLIDDMQVTLTTVGEQKAALDHVAEQLVRLDERVAEARGTKKALQAERKVSQRIVEQLQGIHARAAAGIRKAG